MLVKRKEDLEMRYLSTIVLVFVMLALPIANSVALAEAVAAEPAYSGYPTFSIVSVVKDTSVTIKTYNLPANDNFKTRMGKMGTKALMEPMSVVLIAVPEE